MSRRFFLTGATGVVGLSILEQLTEQDHVFISLKFYMNR
jgi:NAD dependent epimerase/dehydratase family enzyme